MAESVPAEPIEKGTTQYTYGDGGDYVPDPYDSEKLPVTLVSEVQKFLRVANQIELEEPRVAYLCRFHAFEVTKKLDGNSSGCGVRKFKTSLLQRLEQDDEVTLRKRKEKSDIQEVRRVYHRYKDYIIKHGGEVNLENREKLTKARAIAAVVYDVCLPPRPPPLPQPYQDVEKAEKSKTSGLRDVKKAEESKTSGSSDGFRSYCCIS